MAKRDKKTTRTNRDTTPTGAPGATASDATDQRVVAFAEQLGRIVGTFQANAAGWMDREALTGQIARVRDSAADLLDQLAGGTAKVSKTQPAAAATPGRTKGRSGGVVDAPGKKRRGPTPAGPHAHVAKSQAAKMRTAKTMIKTNRHRGRG